MSLVLAPNGDLTVAINTSMPITGWLLRVTVATPELLEFESPLVDARAAFNIPPSFRGRRWRIELFDPVYDDLHFIDDGLITVGLVDPGVQTFDWEPDDPSMDPNSSIVYEQGAPSDTWTIVHGMGGWPQVTIVDSAGTEILGGLEYLDANTVKITFSAPFSGRAFIGG